MRKTELVALLRVPASPPPPQRCIAYVTLNFDDNGSCRIHSAKHGNKEIVTNERYFVMPWKVRDHCHYTGLYRGAAHFSCSLQYKILSYIPVVFHNLAGYDAHLSIRELAKYTTGIGVIAKNTEDYISFSIKVEVDKYIDKKGNEQVKEMELRFIDSIKFMSSSLDSLVNNLARGGQELFGFESYNDRQCELLIHKGIYPYEYMDSWDRFKETSLPSNREIL